MGPETVSLVLGFVSFVAGLVSLVPGIVSWESAMVGLVFGFVSWAHLDLTVCFLTCQQCS